MASKRIIVTGGLGFIGYHLCKKLYEEGNYVIVIDNLSTGSRNNKVTSWSPYGSMRIDVRNIEDLHYPYNPHDCDEIYNLACPASPEKYQKMPVATTRACTVGVMKMLDIANHCGAKILQASTSEVYGDSSIQPQIEGYWGNVNPIGPRSCYNEGKRCAESLFYDYKNQYGTDIRVARIFNSFGPNMLPDDGRVVSNFIVKALNGEDINIYGDGTQTRTFCYVDDTVDGLIRLMGSNYSETPVNIGSEDEYTIADLADIIIKLTGSKSKIVNISKAIDDPHRRKPHIGLARRVLDGWEPDNTLEQGLMKTVSYYRKILN